MKTSSGDLKKQSGNEVNIKHVRITHDDSYILTIGFEVNYPTAFVNDTQNLGQEDPPNTIIGDFGHGFFYVTNKSNNIVTSLSFGPITREIEDTKSGQARAGTIHYPISEVTRLFRFKISDDQYTTLKNEVNEFEKKVNKKEILYDPLWNDTCAACARMTLEYSNISTPSGEGYVTGTGSSVANFVAGIIKMVTPYSWHKNNKIEYDDEIIYMGVENKAYPDKRYSAYPNLEIKLADNYRWVATPGDIDPLSNNSQYVAPPARPDILVIHGDLRNI